MNVKWIFFVFIAFNCAVLSLLELPPNNSSLSFFVRLILLNITRVSCFSLKSILSMNQNLPIFAWSREGGAPALRARGGGALQMFS